MQENHSHPVICNRGTVIVREPPSIPPPPVIEPPVVIPPPPPPTEPAVPPTRKEHKAKAAKRPSVPIPSLVTCIITNYKTKRLTKAALSTFRRAYRKVSIILIDNGSHDDSTKYVQDMAQKYSTVTAVLHEHNIGHGPAMDWAIKMADTPYIFTLDSDCEVNNNGFLERMIELFQTRPNLYALGWLRYVDAVSGVSIPARTEVKPKHVPYIHPSAAMYDRGKYLQLPPFSYDGAPCTANMREARNKGMVVLSFPIDHYITHLIAGTRRMYEGRWNPRTTERPGPWNKDRAWPI